jgi:hypothetical protein
MRRDQSIFRFIRIKLSTFRWRRFWCHDENSWEIPNLVVLSGNQRGSTNGLDVGRQQLDERYRGDTWRPFDLGCWCVCSCRYERLHCGARKFRALGEEIKEASFLTCGFCAIHIILNLFNSPLSWLCWLD